MTNSHFLLDGATTAPATLLLEANTYADLASAVAHSSPGDVLRLAPGHYWGDGLAVRWPLTIEGDGGDSSRYALLSVETSCVC